MEKSWKTAELAETYNENDPQPRFLGLSETVSPLEMIDETGCWCNFQDGSALNGKGQPSSDLDALCKELTDAYKCIQADILEASNGAETCSPWNTSYEMFWYPDMPNHEILSTCEFLNNGHSDCDLKSCYVEYYFLTNLWQLKDSIGSNAWNVFQEQKHDRFKHADECVMERGPFLLLGRRKKKKIIHFMLSF